MDSLAVKADSGFFLKEMPVTFSPKDMSGEILTISDGDSLLCQFQNDTILNTPEMMPRKDVERILRVIKYAFWQQGNQNAIEDNRTRKALGLDTIAIIPYGVKWEDWYRKAEKVIKNEDTQVGEALMMKDQ